MRSGPRPGLGRALRAESATHARLSTSTQAIRAGPAETGIVTPQTETPEVSILTARRSGHLRAQPWRARWLAITIIAASAAVSSCAGLDHAGTSEPAARYVGTAQDTCPYVSADQIAAVTGRDVMRASLHQQPDAQGGRGCIYDLAVNPADQMTQQYVVFSYFRGIGEQGFEHWADAGELVSGLGVKAMWGSATLTVLTRQNDVVDIYMFTANGDLAQAQQIFHLAAPKLRAASSPAGFTPAQLRFLAWYNGGGIWIGNVMGAMGKLASDLTFDLAAVHRDALALQSAVAKAMSNPSPIDAADYKAAITEAAGVALDALRHVPVDKQLIAAGTHMAAFSAAERREFAAMNSR